MKNFKLLALTLIAGSLLQVTIVSAEELIMLKRNKSPTADTNDAERINQAIEQVNATGGGVVLLAGGTFHVASPVNVLSNVILKGRGPGTKIRLVDNAPSFSATSGIVRMIDDRTDTSVQNAGVQDLTIEGNRDKQNQNVGESEKKFCLYAEGENLTISRVIAQNCMGYGFNPHGQRTAAGPRIPSTNIVIQDSIARNNLLDGFAIDQTENSTFRSNMSKNNGRHGFNLFDNSKDLKITNNISRKNAANGIMVQNGAHALQIENNKIKQNFNVGIMVRQSNGNLISDNLIHNNGYEAVKLRGSSDNDVTENTVFNNSKAKRKQYFEVKLEDYNGVSSVSNEFYTNIFVSYRSVGVVYEKGGSDLNKYFDNGYKTRVEPFQLSGAGSQEYDNKPALEQN